MNDDPPPPFFSFRNLLLDFMPPALVLYSSLVYTVTGDRILVQRLRQCGASFPLSVWIPPLDVQGLGMG